MDPYSAALLGAALLVGLVVALRAIGVWSSHNEEILAIKRANAERMAALDARNPKKGGSASKKKSKKQEDDDDQDDELEDPLTPILGHPVVRGFAARYGVDVDQVLDGDEREVEKVVQLLGNIKAPKTKEGTADWNAGNLPPTLT